MPPPRIVAVVPARMASSRFPGKPLAPIRGIPMVEHVRRRALLSKTVYQVVVATCDEAIQRSVESHGGTAVMTSASHERCTDRVAEAARNIPGDIFVMVQGDEPLLDPNDLDLVVVPLLRDSNAMCTNLLSPLGGPQDASNPDVVKAAIARDGRVLFFTRAPIPFVRSKGVAPVYRQTGIMAFRRVTLERYSATVPTPLEQIESVDMLRLLEAGIPVLGVLVDHPTQGVDRPADLNLIEETLAKDPRQQELLDRTLAEPLMIGRKSHD